MERTWTIVLWYISEALSCKFGQWKWFLLIQWCDIW